MCNDFSLLLIGISIVVLSLMTLFVHIKDNPLKGIDELLSDDKLNNTIKELEELQNTLSNGRR